MRDATSCESCGAPIVWRAHSKTGKLAPIDAAPNPDGNAYLMPGGRYGLVTAREREAGFLPRTPLYMPHYATCPQADLWRNRGR